MASNIILALDWYIADGQLKAETSQGTYTIQQSSKNGFDCQFVAFPVNISTEGSGFITDAIQACEKHYVKNGLDVASGEFKNIIQGE